MADLFDIQEYINSNELIQKGLENNLILFNDDSTRITYKLREEKSYSFKDPEERVRAEAYL